MPVSPPRRVSVKAPAAAKKKSKSKTKTPAAKPRAASLRHRDEVERRPAASGDARASQRGISAFAAKAIKSLAPGPYELVPGRSGGVVSLPEVLAKMGSSREGQAAVSQLLETLRQKTGVAVAPEVQAALLSNPSAATTALELTPRQLSQGIAALNAAYQAGQVKQVEPRKRVLPRTGFDLGGIAALAVEREAPKLKEVAPGLFTGSLPGALGDAQVKTSRVLAEVLDRLSRNASAGAGETFSVTYRGKAYERSDELLAALRAGGHEVKVTFEQRAANFADLKTPVPGSNPPAWLDVPAPLMLRTGIRDPAGNEAVLPAAHSEMIVSITGPELDTQVRFFQGVDGTGFFPRGASAEPKWLGRVTHGEVSGERALEAVRLAGALSDVIGTSARAANLYADGYGVTGVCNDSVAVVQQALMGRADQYPLLMRDEVLFGVLKQRLSDAELRDDPTYRALKKAIEALPSDVQSNPTLRERALCSIPWSEGQEPFTSTVLARRILGGSSLGDR